MSLRDEPASWQVTTSETVYAGRLIGMRRDTIEHDGETFEREVVTHPGAVAVVALDDTDRVLVLHQYRHPCRSVMVEIPAGLLDVEGEPPIEAAKRELREEGMLEADRWTPLFEMRTSAGSSEEAVHLFLAEDLRPCEVPDGFVAQYEEASMTREWVPLSELTSAVLSGQVANSLTIAGSLAVALLRDGNHQFTPSEST